jgi:hypothetical protein
MKIGFYYFPETNLLIHLSPFPHKKGVWLWEHPVGRHSIHEIVAKQIIEEDSAMYLGE